MFACIEIFNIRIFFVYRICKINSDVDKQFRRDKRIKNKFGIR